MEQQELGLKFELDPVAEERHDVAESSRRRLLNQYVRFAKMEKMEKLEKKREMYRKQKEILIKQMTGVGIKR